MGHIDYDAIASLDALIDVSDAAARATMIRLRDRLRAIAPRLEERLVTDGLHRKPTIAFYQGSEALLHVYPEPGLSNGLHVMVPLRHFEQDLITTDHLAAWLRDAVAHAQTRKGLRLVEATLRSPTYADDLVVLLHKRLEVLPRLH
jgi:hypothetical protein